MPVTRTTKMPIAGLVEVESFGLSYHLDERGLQRQQAVVVQVTAGTSSALDFAIDSPPQLDW